MARTYGAVYGASASNKRIAVFLGVGFAVGLALGYCAMGTLHAVRLWGGGPRRGARLPPRRYPPKRRRWRTQWSNLVCPAMLRFNRCLRWGWASTTGGARART